MKKLFLGLIFAVLSFGQTTGANVVTQILVNNQSYTTISTNLFVGVVQNIGQSSHMVRLQFSSVNAGSSTLTGQLQGSSDAGCSTTYPIGPVVVANVMSGSLITLVGYGSYPCISISTLLSLPGGTHTATVTETYIGNSSPSLNNVDQTSSIVGMQNASINSLIYGADTSIPFQIVGGGTSALYGFSISGTSSLTAIQMFCFAAGQARGNVFLSLTNASNLLAIFPESLRAYAVCPPINGNSYGIGYNATGSGAGTINISARAE